MYTYSVNKPESEHIDKTTQLIIIGLMISLTATMKISFESVAPGFVFALDVVVLAVFIYCYREIEPLKIILFTTVFSPYFRFVMEFGESDDPIRVFWRVLPDAGFFLVYGLVFLFCVRTLMPGPMPLKNFIGTILASDFAGNLVELLLVDLMNHSLELKGGDLLILAGVAVLRSFIVFCILLAIEYYVGNLIEKEEQEQFESLIHESILIADEFRIIESNKEQVEHVMKQAYDLHTDMRKAGLENEYIRRALDVARGAHEIKGNYNGFVTLLNELYRGQTAGQDLRMSRICHLIHNLVLATDQKEHRKVQLEVQQKEDFVIRDGFKIISVLRNLVMNAMEAIGDQEGHILIRIERDQDHSGADCYRIDVKDDGPGIPEEIRDSIFISGFSTKMNYETGYVQRGLGLPLVREYVEKDYHGSLEMESKEGEGTVFRIMIPVEEMERGAE